MGLQRVGYDWVTELNWEGGGDRRQRKEKYKVRWVKGKYTQIVVKKSKIWFPLSGLRNVFVPDYKDEIKRGAFGWCQDFAIHMESEASIDFG